MEDHVFQAALAGLLHDVGKFLRRAGVEPEDAAARGAAPGTRHALATGRFIGRALPAALQPLLSGAVAHHHPQNRSEAWVQLADRLSVPEREAQEDERLGQLQSVFSSLGGAGRAQYVPLRRLNPRDPAALFPTAAPSTRPDEEYRALWQGFEQACAAQGLAQMTDPAQLLETLYNLLQEFSWCIPAGTGTPDISLFDHARTTAALAACLAADDRPLEWCKTAPGSSQGVCLLVGADLSGLQSFIYAIPSSGAARSLRARSFYIQILSEALALELMRRLGLPVTNLVYVGGGGFQALVPLKAEAPLQAIDQDFNNRLLDLHQGSLGLTLAWTGVSAIEFENMAQPRERLGRKLNYKKRQPFSAAEAGKIAQSVGAALTAGGDPLRYCQVSGEDGELVQKDEDGIYKSRFILSLEDLGRLLPKASHLVTYACPARPAEHASHWQQALEVFGMGLEVVAAREVRQSAALALVPVRIWRLDPQADPHEADWFTAYSAHPKIFGYRPFPRLTPLNKAGQPKTTDELARPMSGRFNRWGVLRMDVDNLGSTFRDGFGPRASLARIASLSFSLRMFFEGWLPALAEGENGPSLTQYVYLQYSGGDDLFVIGAWDALPEFALRVRTSFRDYCCGSPALSISGGMCMVDAGFPLYQAARMAGDAEDQAKQIRPDGGSKDAFSFMDETLGWESFMQVKQQAEYLADGLTRGHLPRSLIQTLLSLHASLELARREARRLKRRAPTLGRWSWMAAYQLTRLASGLEPESKAYVLKLLDLFLVPSAQTHTLGLAARWAQYLTRGG